MAYDNNNSGLMYRNPNKQEEKHPDFTGTVTIDGTEYWLSAWTKEAKPDSKLAAKGINKFFSISVNPKDDKPRATKPAAPKGGALGGLEDDIPF